MSYYRLLLSSCLPLLKVSTSLPRLTIGTFRIANRISPVLFSRECSADQNLPKLWAKELFQGNEASSEESRLNKQLRRRMNLALFANRSHEQGDLMPYVFAQEFVRLYSAASKREKSTLFANMSANMGVDHQEVLSKMETLREALIAENPTATRLEARVLHSLTPLYQHLFDDISKLNNGVEFLINMRKDLLDLRRNKSLHLTAELQAFDKHFRRYLSQWFANGFLDLNQITWSSPGVLLEKVMSYEAVHPLQGWEDLRFRTGPNRRVFTFSHRLLPGEPLVILHTLLSDHVPDSIQEVIEPKSRVNSEDRERITTATFYSITSTHRGLDGIGLGNLLIKRVVTTLQIEFHKLSTFVTLSPVPGFRKWLDFQLKEACDTGTVPVLLRRMNGFGDDDLLGCRTLKELLAVEASLENKEICEKLKIPMMQLCARYLSKEKRRGFAVNPVAHFHLRNGASLWRINWLGNTNQLGVAASYGLMVNYRYDLDCIEQNNHDYVMSGSVAMSHQVLAIL